MVSNNMNTGTHTHAQIPHTLTLSRGGHSDPVWSGHSVCHTNRTACHGIPFFIYRSILLVSFLSFHLSSHRQTKAQPYHTEPWCDACTSLLNISTKRTPTLTNHSFPIVPLARAAVRVAMVTKHAWNDELSGKYHFQRKNKLPSLCMCAFASPLLAQVHCRNMRAQRDTRKHTLLYAPHANDGPTCAPSVISIKVADDATLASLRDGSASCHRRVQTNKLELSVQQTIKIQVSHFHRPSWILQAAGLLSY